MRLPSSSRSSPVKTPVTKVPEGTTTSRRTRSDPRIRPVRPRGERNVPVSATGACDAPGPAARGRGRKAMTVMLTSRVDVVSGWW
jgi:hypothetical protein